MQILVFGDSITYGAWDIEGGWVNRLRKYLDSKVIVSNYKESYITYNLGIDGDTSKGLLKRFESEAKIRIWPDDDTLFIFDIGCNDSIFNNKTKKLNCSVMQYEKNMAKLIKLAKKYSSKIVLVSPTPVDESKVDPMPWLSGHSYKNKYIILFKDAMQKLAKKNNLVFIPLYDFMHKIDYWELLSDGCHPNSDGHKFIFELVKKSLVENKFIT